MLLYFVKRPFKYELLLHKTLQTNIKGLNLQVCIFYIQSQLIQFLKFRMRKNSYFIYHNVKYVRRNSDLSLGVLLFVMCMSYILLHKLIGIPSTSDTIGISYYRHLITSTSDTIGISYYRHLIPSTSDTIGISYHRHLIPSTSDTTDICYHLHLIPSTPDTTGISYHRHLIPSASHTTNT